MRLRITIIALVLAAGAAGAPIAAASGPAGAPVSTPTLCSERCSEYLPRNPAPAPSVTQPIPGSAGTCSEICSQNGRGYGPDNAVATPVIVRTISPSTGFHWRDAGIGAGGGLGLSMLGVGGVLALSGRRERQVRGSAIG